MADRLWRAQVSIPLVSGVPEDSIVNTWHFDDDDDPAAAPEDTGLWIRNMLNSFYDAVGVTIFANTVGGDATVKMYDMAAPEPRQPIYTDTFSVSKSGSPPLVSEAALCLSFAAAQESGVSPGRRRGRVYLGPLCQAQAEVVNGQLRPTQIALDTVRLAAIDLQAGFEHPGSPGFRLRWALYSPTTHAEGGSVGGAFHDVLTGWIDNAYDTQRRRGPDATARVTFP